MKNHTDIKVGTYCRVMGVDFWDAALWKQEMEKHEVRIFAFLLRLKDALVSCMNLLYLIISCLVMDQYFCFLAFCILSF